LAEGTVLSEEWVVETVSRIRGVSGRETVHGMLSRKVIGVVGDLGVLNAAHAGWVDHVDDALLAAAEDGRARRQDGPARSQVGVAAIEAIVEPVLERAAERQR